jgi:hypothetical protein
MQPHVVTVPPFPQNDETLEAFVDRCVEGYATLLQGDDFAHREIVYWKDTKEFMKVLRAKLVERLEPSRLEITNPWGTAIHCTIWAKAYSPA